MTRRSDTRFRQRKLSNKQSLAVLRESQYDAVEDDAQRNIPQIETGVERGEEIEHHLQAAINSAASGVSEKKKVVIPTPATSQLPDEDYAKRYPKRFKLPVSYIRFSSTVEDCNGTAYCMSGVDDKFLAELNSSRPGLPPIKEDEFETIIDAYEAAIQVKQPFLATEPSSISSYEDLEEYLDDALNPELKPIAKLVYGHWKAQKLLRGGRSIIPSLKFEQGNEKDDGDPYVCFRRREVRNTRKTRRTDTTSTDKLKRLRQELEIARGLVKDVWQRETMRKATFELERNIFEKRRAVVDLKRKYQIKDTDEDLINKRTRPEQTAPTTRIPVRHDGKPPEADLKQLVHILAEEEKRIRERALQLQRARHRPDVVDLTNDAVSTLPYYNPHEKFVGVQTFFAPLPTPPSSNDSAPNSPEPTQRNAPISPQQPGRIPVVLAPPWQNVPNFRRRLGRGGRMFIDRRSSRTAPRPDGVDDLTLDRYKYDNYDDSDSEPPSYQMNLHSEE
ncbi:hypothetical protein EX30DRAFT_384020 [Ascodesmis nigricans]|uniref:Enhancer of polycomb-like protein n=1 Tax=Ascodesmis nigricans TaxID=341454 RepID=A0A4S2N0Q4_9PEZI|nr:hypothetical protein EX30DRAFT_384020 [Ascodesmis nigricans]